MRWALEPSIRRLLDEGTSYKAVLDQLRHELAIHYLKAGDLNIEAIALSLGYGDSANFRRAFKRWEGIAPSQWPMGF